MKLFSYKILSEKYIKELMKGKSTYVTFVAKHIPKKIKTHINPIPASHGCFYACYSKVRKI